MTITTERETQTVTPTIVAAVALRNALSACLLSTAPTVDMLPVLHAVHVAKDGNVLTFRATDRYRLTVVTVELQPNSTPEGDWETLIDAADVKRIVTMLPKTASPYGIPSIATIAPDAVTLPGAGQAGFQPVDGQFPKVENVIPTTTEATDEIGFNPKHLATLDKMPGRYKNEPVRFKFNGAGKPAVVRWTDDKQDGVSYLYLLMPVRLSS